MKKYLLILLLFYTQPLVAQVTTLKVHLWEDDVCVSRDMKFEVYLEKKSIPLFVQDSFLMIPDSFLGKQVNVIMTTKDYQLHFDNIILGWNPNYLHWVIYVDRQPIHEKWKWQLKTAFHKVKWLFCLNRGNGTELLFYGFKRPKNGVMKISK